MSISVRIIEESETVEISILGSFDFSLFDDFRLAYSQYVDTYNAFIVDMSMVEYLDSAALGMLLSMKNFVGSNSTIELQGANEFIKNILMISRFDKLFTIQ